MRTLATPTSRYNIVVKRELLIALADIETFCIECSNPKCKSQIRIPVSADIHFSEFHGHKVPLEFCPACQTEWGASFRQRIEALRGALASLADRSPAISLQISADARDMESIQAASSSSMRH